MFFNFMMILSIILNITSLFQGGLGFSIWGAMFYIVGCQCLHMHQKYVE